MFNVQKALVQPMQMCMLDIPLSVQDDDVSTEKASKRGVLLEGVGMGHKEPEGVFDPHPPIQPAAFLGTGKFW